MSSLVLTYNHLGVLQPTQSSALESGLAVGSVPIDIYVISALGDTSFVCTYTPGPSTTSLWIGINPTSGIPGTPSTANYEYFVNGTLTSGSSVSNSTTVLSFYDFDLNNATTEYKSTYITLLPQESYVTLTRKILDRAYIVLSFYQYDTDTWNTVYPFGVPPATVNMNGTNTPTIYDTFSLNSLTLDVQDTCVTVEVDCTGASQLHTAITDTIVAEEMVWITPTTWLTGALDTINACQTKNQAEIFTFINDLWHTQSNYAVNNVVNETAFLIGVKNCCIQTNEYSCFDNGNTLNTHVFIRTYVMKKDWHVWTFEPILDTETGYVSYSASSPATVAQYMRVNVFMTAENIQLCIPFDMTITFTVYDTTCPSYVRYQKQGRYIVYKKNKNMTRRRNRKLTKQIAQYTHLPDSIYQRIYKLVN